MWVKIWIGEGVLMVLLGVVAGVVAPPPELSVVDVVISVIAVVAIPPFFVAMLAIKKMQKKQQWQRPQWGGRLFAGPLQELYHASYSLFLAGIGLMAGGLATGNWIRGVFMTLCGVMLWVSVQVGIRLFANK